MLCIYSIDIEETYQEKERLEDQKWFSSFYFRENPIPSNERKLYFKEGFIMKEFVKDYMKLCKDAGVFYKKHWKGVVVMNTPTEPAGGGVRNAIRGNVSFDKISFR